MVETYSVDLSIEEEEEIKVDSDSGYIEDEFQVSDSDEHQDGSIEDDASGGSHQVEEEEKTPVDMDANEEATGKFKALNQARNDFKDLLVSAKE